MNTPGEYIQAITIARMIIVYSRNKTPPTTYNLFGQIHSIL